MANNKKSRVKVLSYQNGMVPKYYRAFDVDDLLEQLGLNGDTMVTVNGSDTYAPSLEDDDVVTLSKGSMKSA